MSGGSHNYIYLRLEEECEGKMHDEVLNDMVEDFIEVLHDLEWWHSGDISEEEYRDTVEKFKRKWFGKREVVTKDAIKRVLESAIQQIDNL